MTAHGCLVLSRQDVAIAVHRDSDPGVAEVLGDQQWVVALRDQERGAGVAQVMEPKSWLVRHRLQHGGLEHVPQEPRFRL